MCVEVLIRISGKHALFQMEAWHVAQSVRMPGALFQYFQQLKLSKPPIQDDSSTFQNNHISDPVGGMQFCGVDRRFAIDLFAACCRLLYTVLEHHKREIDEALRPGVYALIDACSAEYLQHLHTVYGEGPCRNTLASLQRDYKLNF